MGKLQEQLTTGKKVNRPSDDPVTVMKGMNFRKQVDKVEQFQRNLGEVNNWLDSSDDALDQVGSVLHRANELLINASNDTLTQHDREAILAEVKELRKTVQDLANTKVGDKYIFSGTKTETPLYVGGFPVDDTDPNNPIVTPAGFSRSVEIEVFDGVMMTVNTEGAQLFKSIDNMFQDIENAIESEETSELDGLIQMSQERLDDVLSARANIGARQNRVEMMENRLAAQEGAAKKQMSENEDIEYEEVITEMITEESIHRAALAIGARIIQPSLVDFLR